jgi:hypothetical protein
MVAHPDIEAIAIPPARAATTQRAIVIAILCSIDPPLILVMGKDARIVLTAEASAPRGGTQFCYHVRVVGCWQRGI